MKLVLYSTLEEVKFVSAGSNHASSSHEIDCRTLSDEMRLNTNQHVQKTP
jgi:hypothetical protein